ncbi:MAG TPA: hypothetical protein VMS17_12550 [Gemmataceae bacterium]|nr:hypothetical protein [Gemmataceae bacterium]
MTMKVNSNGQARKSLSEQIDRLDAMLDGLAEGLNEAVAMVVKEAVGMAVKEAVQAVLREALANPELLARLAGVAKPAPQPAPKVAKPKVSWKQRWAGIYNAVATKLNAARQWCGRRLDQARNWASGLLRRVRALACFKYQLLTALGVGLAVGAAAYFAGPWLAAGVSALGGFGATLAVHAGLWLRRVLNASISPGA